MTIITIKTDNPEAEIGLYEDHEQLAYLTWPAHRELAETIHHKLRGVLEDKGKNWQNIHGIVFYKGPGSFTGLRIGASVANALAEGLQAPIVGSTGEAWMTSGIERLLGGEWDPLAMPEYGAEPHITTPKR